MPVTARLSKRFYEALGEETAQELVDWFNQVDATYRADLRELNELNFARFDAKLEQRVSVLEAKLEQRVSGLEAKLEQRLAEVKAELRTEMGQLRGDLAATKAELIRWMFLFWVGTVGTFLALSRFLVG